MSVLKTQDQGLITLSQQDYLPILVESFLIDRRSQGLSPDTIEPYTKKLQYFLKYCERQALTQISQLTSDFIRRYLLELSETHNPGGVHACFRPLWTMLYWLEEEEIMPQDWKNPIRRVKAPKLPTDPIEPIQIEEIHQLLKTCQSNYSGVGDKAMMLGLLDTGARAKKFLNINLEDVDLATGAVMIRQGKGRKPRMVFLGDKSRQVLRKYVKERKDYNPALWVSKSGERLTETGLRMMLRRRAAQAGVPVSSPHDFRRAFAIERWRAGVDILTLSKLMGHTSLQVLNRTGRGHKLRF
jgi:site-specific recombinase XerD